MYQRCPTCSASGKTKKGTTVGYVTSYEDILCPTCCGERIIDQDTGLPPSKKSKAIAENKELSKITFREFWSYFFTGSYDKKES